MSASGKGNPSVSKSHILHVPNLPIIRICQFLEQKEIYRFEQTCKYIRKAAIDPNANKYILCIIKKPKDLNRYTQNPRYDKIESLEIDFFKYDKNAEVSKNFILPTINTFPHLSRVKYYCSIPYLNFRQRLCEILACKPKYDKLDLSVVDDPDLQNWGWNTFLTEFFGRNNVYRKRILANAKYLKFDFSEGLPDPSFAFIRDLRATFRSMEKDPYIDDSEINLELFSYSALIEVVKEAGVDFCWHRIHDLSRYCQRIYLTLVYRYNEGSYSDLDWIKFVDELLKCRGVNRLAISIIDSDLKEKDCMEIADFEQHMCHWLRIDSDKMRRIGLEYIQVMIHYDDELDLELIQRLEEFSKQCKKEGRMFGLIDYFNDYTTIQYSLSL